MPYPNRTGSVGTLHWTLTQLDPTQDATRTWTYEAARDGWAAYEHRINEHEASGWRRHGPEETRYGRGASQEMRRGDKVITIRIAWTSNPER